MKHKGKLPNGTRIRLYVGDKYSNGDKVNVYYYNESNKKLELVKEQVIVKDGYIEFVAKNGSDYFVTMSNVNLSDSITNTKKSISVIPFIVITVIILIALFFILLLKSKKKKKYVDDEII